MDRDREKRRVEERWVWGAGREGEWIMIQPALPATTPVQNVSDERQKERQRETWRARCHGEERTEGVVEAIAYT